MTIILLVIISIMLGFRIGKNTLTRYLYHNSKIDKELYDNITYDDVDTTHEIIKYIFKNEIF